MIDKDIIKQLEKDFSQDKFLSSAIFAGPSGSGKLTCALDIAYRLSGGDEEGIQLYSVRNIQIILKNAYDNFMKNMDKDSTLYFLKAVRIAFLRLATGGGEVKAVKSKRDEIMLAVENIGMLKDYSTELSKNVEDVYKLLSGFKYAQSISVDDIRSANKFLHSTNAFSKAKVVILENLEEQNRSVSNALLKLLEEPPRDSVIIILSSSSNLLLKTITSRSRVYNFSSDSGEYVAKTKEIEDLKTASVLYTKSLVDSAYNPALADTLNAVFKPGDLSQKEKGKAFIEFTSDNLRRCYREGLIEQKKSNILLKRLRNSYRDIAVYNQSCLNSLEKLLFSVL